MQLLTEEIKRKLPKLGATDGNGKLQDKIAVVKFFNPAGSWTWYAIEGEEQDTGDFLFFGWVDGFEPEWGYFSLNELKSVDGKLPIGLSIERDIWFDPRPMKEIADYKARGPFID